MNIAFMTFFFFCPSFLATILLRRTLANENTDQTMQRFTISLDDDLAERFDTLIQIKSYTNRSKAFRDMLLAMLSEDEFAINPQAECVAVVSYTYNHHERQLALRLTEHQHHHSDMVISTMHVHVSGEECAETVVIRGVYQDVKALAESLIAEPGIRHGGVNIMPVTEASGTLPEGSAHTHDHEAGHDHDHPHEHTHVHSHAHYSHSHPHTGEHDHD